MRKQAFKNILQYIKNWIKVWYKENTADTYLELGFRSVEEHELFIKQTNLFIKWCGDNKTYCQLENLVEYYFRHLDSTNFRDVTKFIKDENTRCNDAINKAIVRLQNETLIKVRENKIGSNLLNK